MKTNLLKALVTVNWVCSAFYLYAGDRLGGFGPQDDYRQLALGSLILSTLAMVDKSFIRYFLGLRKIFRFRHPLPELE